MEIIYRRDNVTIVALQKRAQQESKRTIAKFVFSKDMNPINQILLCDHFQYSVNEQSSLCGSIKPFPSASHTQPMTFRTLFYV